MADDLSKKNCIPCSGKVSTLSAMDVQILLKQLPGDWKINTNAHLEKTYKFKNFQKSMDAANIIANIADKQQHHPDLYISWGKCAVEIWTHACNSLTENDFILAAKIEESLLSN